ncbi:hypothetical protein BRAO375_3450006 [Bradyrhizobium sp. ORS 375]|nr:hypothetical protein BRAO375_3450006 [Bradyrhizobium sp. ORS 375]
MSLKEIKARLRRYRCGQSLTRLRSRSGEANTPC